MDIVETNLAGLTLHGRGKVRDIYDLGEHFLIVASDRLSAFDVVLPTPVPDKARSSPRCRSSGSITSKISCPITWCRRG